MTHPEYELVILLATLVLAWLSIVAFTAATRAFHDARRSVVAVVERLVARRVRNGLDVDDVDRLLRKVPLTFVAAFAADSSAEPAAAAAAAAFVVARRREELIAAAVAGKQTPRLRRRRISALRVLTRAGDVASLPLLVAAAHGADPAVANAAVVALGDVGTPAAARALVDALRDGGACPRSRIAAQLETTPAWIDHLLAPLLRHPEPEVRYWAAKLVARPIHRLAVERLARDDEPAVRAAAADALAAFGAAAPLVRLLGDDVAFVRAHAARGLAAAGDSAHSEQIAALLGDESWWVRRAAKDALRRIGPAAVSAVVDRLDDEDRFVRDGAAEILQHVGGQESAAPLAVAER